MSADERAQSIAQSIAQSGAPTATWYRRIAPTVLVVVATIVVYGGFLVRHGIETHEGIDPYARTEQLLVEIRAGNVPPQVLPDARLGAGAAFPRFYPPLPFGVAAMLAAITGDVVIGVNLAFFFAALASGLTMLYAVRRLGGDRWLAAGAACIYLALPYHVFDAFVRGALAELWAFVWVPLVFLGAWRTIDRGRLDPLFAVAFAALILSHTISALLGLLVVGFVAIAALARKPSADGGVARRRSRALGSLVAGGLLAIGLAAWFLVPQQLEVGDVWASDREHMQATSGAVDRERLDPGDLVGSWRNGFRGYSNPPEVADHRGDCYVYFCGSRNFALGPVTLALPIVLVGLGAASRRPRVAGPRPGDAGLVVALGGATVMLIAFALRPGPFLAVLPAQYGYVQFPWRALVPAAATTALLWAIALRGVARGGTALAIVGVAAVALLPAAQRDGVDRRDQRDECFTRADVRAPNDTSGDHCFERNGRFDPAAIGDPSSRAARSARGFTTGADYLPLTVPEGDPGAGVTVAPELDGDGEITDWRRTGDGLSVEIDARATVVVRMPVTSYEFTRVSVRGANAQRVDRNGLVAVRVEKGRATIDVSRGRTSGDWLGASVSLISAAFLVAYAVRRRTASMHSARAKLRA